MGQRYKFEEHRFYKTKQWRKKRLDILKRDNYECQVCKGKGLHYQATTVHHIIHLRDNKELALVDKNLMSVCGTCHNELHPEKLLRNTSEIHAERWE